MRAAHIGALLAVTLLAGCSSHPEIPVSDQQSLVMESNVLAAGISAEVPTVTASEIQATATTVHYRFFWYDARGLEMHPLESARSITVPAHSSVTLYGSANILGAHKARLYLYL